MDVFLCLKDQYVFIHDALLDYITCGDTTMSASSLRSRVNKMSKVIPGKALNVYDQQFEVQSEHFP